jgi:hypothetical protein
VYFESLKPKKKDKKGGKKNGKWNSFLELSSF